MVKGTYTYDGLKNPQKYIKNLVKTSFEKKINSSKTFENPSILSHPQDFRPCLYLLKLDITKTPSIS